MEAWKFIDYTNLDTLSALSLTASRWGLGPFPSYITVANVGDTTIGPAHANIVGVVHGVSLIITLIAMTGFAALIDRITKPRNPTGLNGSDLSGNYNQPVRPEDRRKPTATRSERAGEQPTDAVKTKWITACTDLLRRRYDTQIQIWSCGDERQRQELQYRANAMHNEICRTVDRWQRLDRATWTAEEWAQIQEICSVLVASQV
jgi:hypothetical protein